MTIEEQEREKYLAVWKQKGYRTQCDGEPVVVFAHVSMGCVMGESVIDWGTGTGRAAAAFDRFGLRVTCFDIAHNCLDADVRLPLVTGTLWDPPAGLESDYAFCTDVLEHLPEEKVDAALDAIRSRTRKAAFLQVDTAVDLWGDKLGTRLHLTVKPAEWWHEKISKRWDSVQQYPGSYTRVNFLCR